MSDWINWAILAGVLVIAELFTGTFYLLMIALGMLSGAAAAALGAPLSLQLAVAAVVGAFATELLRRKRQEKGSRDAERDPNVNLDIGQLVRVDTWQDGRARVMYRGAMWDVELAPDAAARPDDYRIAEVRGNRLILANT